MKHDNQIFSLPTAVDFALNSYVYSWDGRTIYMRNFLVHEPYRSKGVAKLIFQGLLKHAKETGCNRIEIHVSDWNTVARKFYEKMGAINVSERDGHVYYRLFKDVIDKVSVEDKVDYLSSSSDFQNK